MQAEKAITVITL